MQLYLHGLNIEASDTMHQHAERRFEFALDRVSHAVRSVTLRLKDVNGPKGGINKRCQAVVELTTGERLIVEDLDEDVYDVVSRVAGRAKHIVKQHLGRQRERRRCA